MSHIDMIIECTDKLLNRWHFNGPNHLHKNMVVQIEQLTMAIFGFFGFGYDLKTLDDEEGLSNEFTRALQVYIAMSKMVMFYPRCCMIPYIALNRSFREASKIIHRYSAKLIKQELASRATDPETATGPKSSLIASLVSSLEINSLDNSTFKREKEKRGKYYLTVFLSTEIFIHY